MTFIHEFNSRAIQQRVRHWVTTRLGAPAMNPVERATRLLEEAMELAQTCGVKQERAALLLSRVYAKEPGVVAQEIGGVMTTVLALAESYHYSASACAFKELERIEDVPAEKFQIRQQQNAQDGIGDWPVGVS